MRLSQPSLPRLLAGVLFTFFFATAAFAQDNQPPFADAGPDVQASENELTQLDGSNSIDPEFFPLTYSWTQIAGPTAILSNQDSVILDIQVPTVGGVGGVMTFQLTITDSEGESSSDTANVIIKKVNMAPVAAIIAPSSVAEGAFVTLDGSGSYDPNDDVLTYTWLQTAGPAVTLDLTDPVRPTFTAPTTGTGTLLRFRLTVSDSQLSASTLADISVTVANHAPTANAGSNQTVGHLDAVTLDGTASADPDGQSLTYAWTQTAGPAVTLNLANPAKPTFTAPATTSTLKFSLVVSDGSLNSTASLVSVFVYPDDAIPNCANAHANKFQIWPPNRTMSRVKIRGMNKKHNNDLSANVENNNDDGDDGEGDDDSDDSDEETGKLIIRVTNVTQDEPTAGTGRGDIGPDAIVQSQRPNGKPRMKDLVLVRRERADSGNGRIYEISFTATNTLSNASCSGKVQVCVPTKKGKKGLCTNSGQNFNSLQ